MKVFISWSGHPSKKLAEAFRDWLPGVLQAVVPYFTPADIEKGSRWSSDISKELAESQIGILCLTKENLHSNWLMFEAGALSKSLEKSYVCPILFGVSNADLAGPLKQFQTTEFNKHEINKLVGVINTRLGEKKLAPKTLDAVFEKWWPDLEERVKETLAEGDQSVEPLRSDRELMEEILALSRLTASKTGVRIPAKAIRDLLTHYIELHDQQVAQDGGYDDALDVLRRMHMPVRYIVHRAARGDEDVQELVNRFDSLSYGSTDDKEANGDGGDKEL